MSQAVAIISCPRCQRTDLTTLALEEDRQRYQCNGCSENFSAPASAVAPEAPLAEAPPGPAFTHAPIVMAEPDASGIAGRCPKCQKPYQRLGKHFEGHVSSCDGTPFVEKKGRASRTESPAPVPAAAAAAAAPVAAPSATPNEITKAFGISIEALKAQRSALEAEIASINGVIATLEKLRGLGGASPAGPFPAGV